MNWEGECNHCILPKEIVKLEEQLVLKVCESELRRRVIKIYSALESLLKATASDEEVVLSLRGSAAGPTVGSGIRSRELVSPPAKAPAEWVLSDVMRFHDLTQYQGGGLYVNLCVICPEHQTQEEGWYSRGVVEATELLVVCCLR
ncbi:hypothetical protein CEXT_186031 [Caerostris extrusa]|uniref:Uncharacterized protein n=1 Tax=Caerostris extrusa TaxID=172846 RepID=A0AAV4MFX4_CAEEX|nr:hypothetical protein CEXT_186031 [Caerostris extrusa]